MYVVRNLQMGHCGICKASDQQTKLIQDSLFDKLKALFQKLKFQEERSEEAVEESLGFQRLLKMIFHKKYKNLKTSTQCKHHELRKQFANRLKCNFKVLDLLSDRVACVTARYSFHIDVVSAQMKTFPRHFAQEKPSTPSKHSEKEERDQTEKKPEKMAENSMNQNETMKRDHNVMVMNPYLNHMVLPQVTYPMNFGWGFSFNSNSEQNKKRE